RPFALRGRADHDVPVAAMPVHGVFRSPRLEATGPSVTADRAFELDGWVGLEHACAGLHHARSLPSECDRSVTVGRRAFTEWGRAARGRCSHSGPPRRTAADDPIPRYRDVRS